MQTTSPPSEWLVRWQHLLAPQSQVLDVACGSGRHAAWLAAMGHQVTGIDRDAAALSRLPEAVTAIAADIENGPWPIPEQKFDAVVVTNYLWRPLLPTLLDTVREGGLLFYETFAQGNADYGKPSRPDFLLAPGELLEICQNWQVLAYEQGLRSQPVRVVQRIAAIKPVTGKTPKPLALCA